MAPRGVVVGERGGGEVVVVVAVVDELVKAAIVDKVVPEIVVYLIDSFIAVAQVFRPRKAHGVTCACPEVDCGVSGEIVAVIRVAECPVEIPHGSIDKG